MAHIPDKIRRSGEIKTIYILVKTYEIPKVQNTKDKKPAPCTHERHINDYGDKREVMP